mmetsp:Transcript_15799/g.19855  ORF Transcript_15799/g.19855 Transcript_15799/m.19855 type:complete len:170 (-) Transcript_15799:467-976(-)
MMVEKLHKFAKWQQTKLAKSAGFASEQFSKELQAMMKKSMKVILNKHNVVQEEERAASAREEVELMDEELMAEVEAANNDTVNDASLNTTNVTDGAAIAEGNTSQLDKPQLDKPNMHNRRASLLRCQNLIMIQKKSQTMLGEFTYAEKILDSMSVKELGILLSCLMPLV